MEPSRRGFVAAGLASLCLPAAGEWNACGAEVAAEESVTAEDSRNTAAGDAGMPEILDYGLSFLCHPWTENSVRFWIESRTILFDTQANQQIEFWQCASCKSEDTFAVKDLFLADNYDFMPIFGGDDVLVFRRRARITDNYRTLTTADKLWGKSIPKLKFGKPVVRLDTFEQIRDATAAGTPLVTRTELANEELGLRAVIECPTKTMNISHTKKMYQVDTGPIALPDLSKRFEPAIDCLRLAFIAFNAPDFADFVVEQPTGVVEEGTERCQIFHYSTPISLKAKNEVYAVGG